MKAYDNLCFDCGAEGSVISLLATRKDAKGKTVSGSLCFCPSCAATELASRG